MQGETMLRIANARDEPALESVRDALDELGVVYEHIRSEPGEDAYPQTAYFYVPHASADEVDAAMQRLADEHGFDAELL
jgi:signal recognition particle subunit SEC65